MIWQNNWLRWRTNSLKGGAFFGLLIINGLAVQLNGEYTTESDLYKAQRKLQNKLDYLVWNFLMAVIVNNNKLEFLWPDEQRLASNKLESAWKPHMADAIGRHVPPIQNLAFRRTRFKLNPQSGQRVPANPANDDANRNCLPIIKNRFPQSHQEAGAQLKPKARAKGGVDGGHQRA